MQRRYLLNDQLRILYAAEFVYIQLIRQLHDATIYSSGLVECDRVHDAAAVCRAHTKFQMVFPDRTLFNNVKVAAPHGFRES